MRRLLTAAILVALVGTSAACGNSDDSSTTATSSTGAAAPAATTASPTPTVDVAANTKEVCGKAEKIITEDAVKPIGEQIGIMIAAKQAKNKTAETAAAAKAKELADALAEKLRALKSEAADPKLQAALDKGADGIKLFGSPEYLAKINSLNDMDKLTTDIDAAGKDLEAICG
ncbi:hypothetical protein ACQP00_50780 [Dactylosporangium sp. CS-047395]|uniref:hypothetical protein n=1 Tax=Dactylosporangium sp. CS-047395 TaxID=3239936 RepID=UPI003D939B57